MNPKLVLKELVLFVLDCSINLLEIQNREKIMIRVLKEPLSQSSIYNEKLIQEYMED